jgi:hypothetical protein
VTAEVARLEPLVGDWIVEASLAPGLAGGQAVFEWALDGTVLLEWSTAPDPVPDGLMVITADPAGDGYTQHYFDSRGVVRRYAMTFRDGRWTLLRVTPDCSPFFGQRWTAVVDDDVIQGRWERSDDGQRWELDFELTYRRA